jgi:hypothetical protein
MKPSQLYKIEFYVPETHLEAVKSAMFEAGAGNIGDYDSCAWQILGQGQFRPLQGSSAYLGEIDKLETIAEYKVEMICGEATLEAAIAALKQAHPYEEVAYFVLATLALV